MKENITTQDICEDNKPVLEFEEDKYPIIFTNEKSTQFIPVDDWVPDYTDYIFTTCKGYISVPIYEFMGINNPNINRNEFNSFNLTSKRSYNNPNMRSHIIHYLNYFEKFYDTDNELVFFYGRTKYLIEQIPSYGKDELFIDIKKYILNGSLFVKMGFMNNDNYSLNLTYKNKKNPALQYSNKHGKILMKLSLIMNAIIPILCHFIYVRKVSNTLDFLYEIYDIIIHSYDVDIYNKLYETAYSNVEKNAKRNKVLWGMQDIRGINETIHSAQCVINIMVNIIPKYVYNSNLVHFNYKSVQKNTDFQVTDIEFEYSFVSLSSSKRDEDNNSEFDKFESFLTRANEELYLQNKVACEDTMRLIELSYGPFSEEEIEFYKRRYSGIDGKVVINSFQKELVFNLFYKYFGDINCIKSINLNDYIKLIMAGKIILESNGLCILPYILSSKVVRLATRKNINKKDLLKIKSSENYKLIEDKYDDEKIKNQILMLIAQIISSDFEIVDPDIEAGLDGNKITVIPDILYEEIQIFINLI